MRAAGGAVQRYVAGTVPSSPEDLSAFLREELAKLQSAYNALADGQLDLTTVAPAKPRDGMTRYAAAGVLGALAGMYSYYGGAWRFSGDGGTAINVTGGSIIPAASSTGGGRYSIDASQAVVLPNGGFIDIANFSGMAVVNDHSTGPITGYFCGGGAVAAFGSASSAVGVSFTYNAGINGYTIQNLSGATKTLGVFLLRTRPGA